MKKEIRTVVYDDGYQLPLKLYLYGQWNKFLALRKSEVAKAAPDRNLQLSGRLGNRGAGFIF